MNIYADCSQRAVIRWAPQIYFNPHKHYGGEEIFVVAAVFEDEHGRYPAESWIRSPHMSLHKPFSKEGRTIILLKPVIYSARCRIDFNPPPKENNVQSRNGRCQ